jgi:hypothetical protein
MRSLILFLGVVGSYLLFGHCVAAFVFARLRRMEDGGAVLILSVGLAPSLVALILYRVFLFLPGASERTPRGPVVNGGVLENPLTSLGSPPEEAQSAEREALDLTRVWRLCTSATHTNYRVVDRLSDYQEGSIG